jgi:hypothetical protein
LETSGEREAIAAAFRDLGPGDLLVIGAGAIDEALACVGSHLGAGGQALAPGASASPEVVATNG